MTKLKVWFLDQPEKDRTAFIERIMEDCGISERTAYRYLTNEPPKLTKCVISQISGICTTDLYTEIKVISHG